MLRASPWLRTIAFALAGSTAVASPLQAPPANEQAPAFLSHLDASCTNLVFVPDPLPHLQRILTSESLRKVLVEGRLAKLLNAFGRGANELDPRTLWGLIDKNRAWVPTEVAIALPAGGMEDIDHLVRTCMLAALCSGAVSAGGDATQKDLPKLQDQLLSELNALHLPALRIFVRFRDEKSAAAVFQLLLQSAGAAREVGIEPELDKDSVRVRVSAAEFVDEGLLPSILLELGILSGENDPKGPALANAVTKLGVEAAVHRFGDALRLTLGPSEGDAKPLRPQDLGELFRTDSSLITFGRWDLRSLKRASREWVRTWETWAPTTTGKRVKEMDESDMLGEMLFTARQIDSTADIGAVCAWADAGLHVAYREEGIKPAAPLAGSKLLQCMPRDVEAFVLDQTVSLADQWVAILRQCESRLEMQSLKAELGMSKDDASLSDAVLAAYYKHLAAFRDLVLNRSAEVFEPPVALLFGTQGKVTRFELGYGSGSKRETLSAKDLPTWELAAIGRVRDPARAIRYTEEVYGSFVRGLAAALGVSGPPPDARVPEFDLGLGQRTLVPDGAWMTKLSGANNFSVTIEGDLRPHFFFCDDLVVFSTSVRLSKRILAARQGKEADRLELPSAPAGALVRYGRVRGQTLADSLDRLGTWIATLGAASEPKGRPTTRREPTPEAAVVDVLGGMGDVARLVDRFEWRSIDEGTVRTTRLEVPFALGSR